MAKKPTVIEINGRKYDADTGEILTAGSIDHSSAQTKNAKLIDGFAAPHRVRNTQPASRVHQKVRRTQKLHPLVAKPPQPKAPIINETKRAATNNDVAKPAPKTLPISPERIERAKAFKKSDQISKFSAVQEAIAKKREAFIPSQAAAPSPKPARREPEAVPDAEEPSDGWFSRLRQSRPKLLPTTATIALALVMIGYVTYLNLPNMALRVAASRAGFEASLPGYKPSGFSLEGPISYAPGQISVRFAAAADDRSFELIQRESTWDSQSLLDNFLVRDGKQPTTFQESGLTIYVYDNSNATWVNNGIWYTIEGQSLLSSEQLLKIATSL